MSAYESRRTRWLKLAEHLPPELRGRIALRNIRAAATLQSQAQKTLASALDAGLRQAGVIRLLQNDPDMALDEIIRYSPSREKPSQNGQLQSQNFEDQNSSHELSILIQTCFPGWNPLAVESLASDPLTTELRALFHAWRVCQASDRARSETFTVLLCGFIVQAAEHLNHIIENLPNHDAALHTSGVDWPFNVFHLEHEIHARPNKILSV